jgi:hypothetical protein
MEVAMAWSASQLTDLVRVVAQDGSVWWVKPASAPWYAQLPAAVTPISDDFRPRDWRVKP